MSAALPAVGTRVGFIGLGNMGGRMTASLVRAGIPVLGFDTLPGRAEEFGATPAANSGDVVDNVDYVLMSLPDSRVVEAVVLGDDGVLAHIREGQVVIDLSTSDPESTKKLNALLQAKGAQLIDAGISGGAAAAEKGTLTLMVGGDAQTATDAQWIFDGISSNVFFMGESGAGHVAKVLNNFLNAISLSATAEVMVSAKKAGLDLATFLDVLNASSGVNFATQNRFPSIILGNYLEGGLSTKLMTKDVVLYVNYLASQGVTSLNASAPMASFALATALGYADQISNRVVDAIGDASGGVRLHTATTDAATTDEGAVA